ncbi:MAG: TonB-dependent hemoglobin/transferrin/lactoferrin family receptor [Rhizobiaceae bacterium]|nr:TonB-dependent hemoglobin/transferrin/lactoferrin family receptor [Rhizobiaceae bacterium]
MTVLLGGAAMTILLGTQAGWAQQAETSGAEERQTAAELNEAGGQPMEMAPVDASSVTLLDRITIVSRVGDSAIDQMASVSTVGGEALERRQATTSQDVFFGIPGVTAQSDSKRSVTSVNVRGLQDFGRVAVIVDGSRQDFHQSQHGTQNFFVLDPELLQQVEVIRGPVANTYGSGAIGGVVVMETKDAGDFLKPEETWALGSTLRYETNGDGWTTSTTGAYRFTDAFDVIGNFVYRDYSDYDDGDGNTVEGTGFDVLSGMLKTTIRPTENSELKLGWIGADNSWTDGGSFDNDIRQNTWTGQFALQDDDQSWLDLHVNLAYNKTNLDQTYLQNAQQFDPVTGLPVSVPAGSVTTYDLGTTSFDIWNTSRFETAGLSHELTYGGDWVKDDVENASGAGGPEVYTPNGTRLVSGAYIQDKITWEWLEVLGALRYDYYKLESDVDEASGDRLSPRITVGVTPFMDQGLMGGLQVYGTYAEGYRSPSVTETLISGMHPQGVAFPFLPNPNLEPETATTLEAGLNFKADDLWQPGDALRLKAAYFNNDIDNYIGLNTSISPMTDPSCPYFPGLPPVWTPGGWYVPTCAQYQNYAKGTIDGFEFEGLYDAQWMFAGLSISLSNGHTINDDGIRESMVTVPPHQATGTLGFRMMENRLTIGGELQYNASADYTTLNEDGDLESYFVGDYTLVNLFASYEANENFRVDFRVDNLLNANYESALNAATLTSPLYEPGITAKIGATLRFGG